MQKTCNHAKKKNFLCGTFDGEDIQSFNDSFFKEKNKIYQDSFIAKYIEVNKKKTVRKSKTQGISPRVRNTGETKFFVYKKETKTKHQVCKDFFQRALGGVGRKRIEGIAAELRKTGEIRGKENRGGDRKFKKIEPKREKIRKFIKSLPSRESHHDRKKSKKRYLPAEMKSLKNIWGHFKNKHPEENVSYLYFRKIVRQTVNIGFGAMKTDACSTCMSLKYKIKGANSAEKSKLMALLRIHKKRANCFYELIKEDIPGMKTFCFDHQQNLVMPRVADQQAYYSRQFYLYNYTVVEQGRNGKLNPENVCSYVWNENEHKKDSSACASALFDALRKADMTGIDTVRLCCDACGGQNKNTAVLYMAGHWLKVYAPVHVKKIEIVFPVRGHSFLPCDRVFGLIEKEIRTHQEIFVPSEYHKMISNFSTVKKVDEDWFVYDFKEISNRVMKKPFPHGIQDNKRFFIQKAARGNIFMSGQPAFRNIINKLVPVTKKGKNFVGMPNLIQKGVQISEMKKNDVKALMVAHCGEDWVVNERFSFLKDLCNAEGNQSVEDDEHMCDEGCECCDREEDENTVI